MTSARMLPLLLLVVIPTASADTLRFRERFLKQLVERTPAILASYDAKTGHFGSGIWICRDQESMLPLAIVYSTPGEGNIYHRDAKLLDAIMNAGDALIEDADANGQWVFRKKDGSTWGLISMPWTYSRWIRTYGLIREQMPEERRKRWADALIRGYGHIARTHLKIGHNISTHHAMGLYIAGKHLDKPEWCEQAGKFLREVVGTQAEGGYWTEGQGPVVNYNFVYVDAVGTYYALSGDKAVLPAIEKALRFHAAFTYPGGQGVETIDQRNPFENHVLPGNPTFTLTPEGRAWLRNQWKCDQDRPLSDDSTALFLLHGLEGPMPDPPVREDSMFVMRDAGADRAAVIRKGPWFICLSAYTTPIATNRWHQDRQNLVSIWHEKKGLVLGGGNTKLQPAWSTFTVGDPALLQHKPGDENPDFKPKGRLFHVPSAATLVREPAPGLDLTYGPETCRIRIRVIDDSTLEYQCESTTSSGLPVVAHVTLLPEMGARLRTGGAESATLGDAAFNFDARQVGGSVEYRGCRFTVPAGASLHWPALPHNPYRKDGRSSPAEGRVELRVPLSTVSAALVIRLEVAPNTPSH